MSNPILSELQEFFQTVKSFYYSTISYMVEPIFSDIVKTAAVMFDPNGNNINFVFNPGFWKTLNYDEKCFVYSHEVLHVLFDHGKRGKDFIDSLPKEKQSYYILNVAQDICINEILKAQIFSDKNLPLYEKMCSIKTVFKEDAPSILKGQNFEYYYNKILELNPNTDIQTLDEHQYMIDGETAEKISETLNKIFGESKDSKPDESNTEITKSYATGGEVSGSILLKFDKTRDVLKPYLKDIHTSVKKGIGEKAKRLWYKQPKRIQGISRDITIPVIEKVQSHRSNILVYCDVSGSVASVSNKFLSMISVMDKKMFKTDLFVFASYVCEAKVKHGSVSYGGAGGGTDIIMVLNHAEKIEHNYDCVLVVTDGYYKDISRNIEDKFKNWYFFTISAHNAPVKAKQYKIKL